MIPDTYTYDAHDGQTYAGSAAYVLNHLDSALASAEDNFRDLTADALFADEEIREEVRLYDAISYLLDHASDLAAYI